MQLRSNQAQTQVKCLWGWGTFLCIMMSSLNGEFPEKSHRWQSPGLSKSSRKGLKEGRWKAGITERIPSPFWFAIATRSSNNQAQPITGRGSHTLKLEVGWPCSLERSSLCSQRVWCEEPWPDIQKSMFHFTCVSDKPLPLAGPSCPQMLRCGGKPTSFPKNSFNTDWQWVPSRMETSLLKYHRIRYHRYKGFLIVYKTTHSAPPSTPVPQEKIPTQLSSANPTHSLCHAASFPWPYPSARVSQRPWPTICCFVPQVAGWALKTLFSEVWEPGDTQSNLKHNFPL